MTAPTPVADWSVPADVLADLRSAVDDFEPHADFHLLRAARALLETATIGPSS